MVNELTEVGIPRINAAQTSGVIRSCRFNHSTAQSFQKLLVCRREGNAGRGRLRGEQITIFVQAAISAKRRWKAE